GPGPERPLRLLENAGPRSTLSPGGRGWFALANWVRALHRHGGATMTQSNADVTPAPPPAASRMRWLPAVLLGVAIVALAVLRYLETSEVMSPANAFLAMFSTVGAASILLLVWFVFFAGVSRKLRRGVGVAAIALLAVA